MLSSNTFQQPQISARSWSAWNSLNIRSKSNYVFMRISLKSVSPVECPGPEWNQTIGLERCWTVQRLFILRIFIILLVLQFDRQKLLLWKRCKFWLFGQRSAFWEIMFGNLPLLRNPLSSSKQSQLKNSFVQNSKFVLVKFALSCPTNNDEFNVLVSWSLFYCFVVSRH